MKKEVRLVEKLSLNTSSLPSNSKESSRILSDNSKSFNGNSKVLSKNAAINLIGHKKYNILDVPKNIGGIRMQSVSPCRPFSSSYKVHENYETSFSLMSSNQNSQTNLLDFIKPKPKLPITLIKVKSSNWFKNKKPDPDLIISLLTDNKQQSCTEAPRRASKSVEKPKSDIEKILESQTAAKKRHQIKDNKKIQVPTLNLNDITCMPIAERSNRSEDSPIKLKEIEKPKKMLNSSTSRSRLNKKYVKLEKICKNSVKGEQILEDIANYEVLIENKPKKQLKRRLFTPTGRGSRITDENYSEMSMKALKNTSFFAEKIMKQIRCSSRCKNLI